MAVFTFPDLPISRCSYVIVFNTSMGTSEVSGHEYITENAGERWVVSYLFNVLTMQEGLALRGHLNKLRGPVNKTKLRDPVYQHQGNWSGSPVVDGTGQYGLYVDVRGFTPNTLVAYATDRFMLGTKLHELTDDVISDATGRARLYVANEIADLTSDGQIIITEPSLLLTTSRWTDPKQIQQLSGNRRLYRNVKLDFIESLHD
ncbi:hypothetical protein [Neptunicella sp. SCSIO 80796]|uniref:hypothetical protein n=1 Tax=Neptunicella plasticusilytica TaxID=3117012 RepID=UPI003A4D5226